MKILAYFRPCANAFQRLSNLNEVIDPKLNAYFVNISNRIFEDINMDISLFDLPVILEPSKEYRRDFNFTAYLHSNRASSRIRKKAFNLQQESFNPLDERNCFNLPTKPLKKSVTPAFNEEQGH